MHFCCCRNLKMKENWSLFRPRFIHWVADLIFRSQPIPALANPWHDTQYVDARFRSMLKTLQKLQMLAPSMSMLMSDIHWQPMSFPMRLAKESQNKLKSYSLVLSQIWGGRWGDRWGGGWWVWPQLIDLLVFFAQTSFLTNNFSNKIEKKGKMSKNIDENKTKKNITSYTASPLFLTSSLPDIFGAILNLNGNHWLHPLVAYWLHIS